MEFNVVGFFVPHQSVQDCKKLTSLIFFESLILAQDERWRRALGMQVERLSVGQEISNFQTQNSKQFQILN